MPDYLVETYSPTTPRLPVCGDGVRLLHTIHLPGDETSLHVFAAPSSDVLRRALLRTAYPFDRIVDAVSLPTGIQ